MEPARWVRSARHERLVYRATQCMRLRQYFMRTRALEVHTPCLNGYGVTDRHLENIRVEHQVHPGDAKRRLYLQTSPEYYLKRLLVDLQCDLYSLGPVFRDQELTAKHQPEFTMLEWYRCGVSLAGLMDDTQALLSDVFGCPEAVRVPYAQLFEQATTLRWSTLNLGELNAWIQDQGGPPADVLSDALDWVFAFHLEPHLASMPLSFVYHYPACQSALARIHPQDPHCALRFEVFVHGIECGNGYEELLDPQEHMARFEHDRALRAQSGAHVPEIDLDFMQALQRGLPPCAGMAMGLERLMSAALQCPLSEVMAFHLQA